MSNLINRTQSQLEHIEKEHVISIRGILAEHAERLLLGGGYTFESDNKDLEKWFSKFAKVNKLDELLHTLVYNLSLEGRVIIIIDKVDGVPILTQALPSFVNKIAKIYVSEKLATLYVRPFIDDRNIIIREEWDEEKVVRTVQDERGQALSLGTINEKLSPEEQIPAVWYHNLGFLPIVEFKNKALNPLLLNLNTLGASQNYLTIADDWKVRNLGRMIDITLRTKAYEVAFNFTKVLGTFSSTKMEKIKNEGGFVSYMLQKVILDITKYGSDGKTPNIEVVEANPHLAEYSESINKDFEKYFEGAGYSTPEQAVMDSATQVLYAKSRDVETTNQKRQLITTKILELLDKCLIASGLSTTLPDSDEDRDYSFVIKNNLQVSETEKLLNIEKKLGLGLMSKLDAITELYGIKKDEAQVKLNEIEAQQDKENERMLEQQAEAFKVSGLLDNIKQPENKQENPVNNVPQKA